jgi:hypothetical protein
MQEGGCDGEGECLQDLVRLEKNARLRAAIEERFIAQTAMAQSTSLRKPTRSPFEAQGRKRTRRKGVGLLRSE